MNYQTVTLSRGKHSSPEDGACVMELASMLAGEPFSDHPDSVCPVLGSFLRAYNDSVDDQRRQDLYRYAAAVVGSRAGEDVEHARAARLASWGSAMLPRRWWRSMMPAVASAVSDMWACQLDTVGVWAVHCIRTHTDETHAAALKLVDELLAVAPQHRPDPAPVPEAVAGFEASPCAGPLSHPADDIATRN